MDGKGSVCKKGHDRREHVHGAMYRRAYWPNEGQRGSPKTYSPMPEEYKRSIDPQQVDENGRTALHLAMMQSMDDDLHLKRVIKAGCGVNAADKDGHRGVHYAAEKGFTRCIVKLAKHGAELNVLNKRGYSPLMLAARHDYPMAVRALIRCGANTNLENDKNEQALHYAICKGNLECVQDLLANKATVNRQNAEGSTPLILATQFGRTDVMLSLISAGAKIDQKDSLGRSALHWASSCGKMHDTAVLLEAGAEIDCFDAHGQSPFVYTIQLNDPEMMRQLLEAGCDRSTIDGLNGTALGLAAIKGHGECVNILLETGDEPDELGFFGLTPLLLATFESHLSVVETLVRHNADPNMPGRTGVVPIIKCLVLVCPRNELKRHQILTKLIRAGADVNVRLNAAGYFTSLTNGKNCPLSFAMCSGYVSLMRILLIAGSKVTCGEIREWSTRDNISRFYTQKSLMAPLREWMMEPRPLRHLCRMTIRNSLASQGCNKTRDIETLPIAPALKKYVDFSDLEEIEPQKAEIPESAARDLLNVQPVRFCQSAMRALEGTFLHQTAMQSMQGN